MTRLFLFFYAVALLACQAQKSEKEAAADSIVSTKTGTSDGAMDSLARPEGESLHDSDYGIFHITLVTVEKKDSIYGKLYANEHKLELFKDPEKTSAFQTIPLSEDVDFNEIYLSDRNPEKVSTADYNFDGYKDLVVFSNSGAHSWWYDIYLYDPKNALFKKHPTLSELETPSIDLAKKEISSYAYGGFGSYSKSIYKWIDDKLTLTYELQQDRSGDEENPEILQTISTLSSTGKMEVASKVKITYSEETKLETHCLVEGGWEEFEKVTDVLIAESQENVVRKNNCE